MGELRLQPVVCKMFPCRYVIELNLCQNIALAVGCKPVETMELHTASAVGVYVDSLMVYVMRGVYEIVVTGTVGKGMPVHF